MSGAPASMHLMLERIVSLSRQLALAEFRLVAAQENLAEAASKREFTQAEEGRALFRFVTRALDMPPNVSEGILLRDFLNTLPVLRSAVEEEDARKNRGSVV